MRKCAVASLEKAKVAGATKSKAAEPTPNGLLRGSALRPSSALEVQRGPMRAGPSGNERAARGKANHDAAQGATVKRAAPKAEGHDTRRLDFDVGNIAIDRAKSQQPSASSTPPLAIPVAAQSRALSAAPAASGEMLPAEPRPAKAVDERLPLRAEATPPVRRDERATESTVQPAGYSAVFAGLAAVAEELHARAIGTASKMDTARPGAARKPGATDIPNERAERPAVAWSEPLGRIAVAAADALEGARTGVAAAAAAPAHSEAVDATPLATEMSRVAQMLHVNEAYLATAVVGRAFENAPILQERPGQIAAEGLRHRAASFDSALAGLAGGAGGAGDVELIAEARLDVAHLAASVPGTKIASSEAERLFDGAQQLNEAVEEAARPLHDPAAFAQEGVGKDLAQALESRLRRVSGAIASGGATEPQAVVQPSVRHPESSEDAERAAARLDNVEVERQSLKEKSSDQRRERPAQWEYLVPEATAVVQLADLASLFHVERATDLRALLAASNETQHRFVLWLRAGTVLSPAVEALVSQGLVETRTLSA